MRRNLLPAKTYYKANLHCHSDLSDGTYTPAELKQLYRDRGYSIVAFTDHDYLFSHTDLADDSFLPLTGYEMQILGGSPELPRPQREVMHLNFIAREPGNCTLVFYDPAIPYCGSPRRAPNIQATESCGQVRTLSPDGINAIIAEARQEGFLVCLNHPTWSMNDRRHYCGLQGLFAMEIYNHTCEFDGHDTYCPTIYDEMLRDGQHIACIAADDNHNRALGGLPRLIDSFGGFTMIASDSLDYVSIISALEQGDFYASRGPRIDSLYVEDSFVHLKCSAARRIMLSCGSRRDDSVRAAVDAPLTEAVFRILPTDRYLRFTVTDEFGRTANTRAYWQNEFIL